MSEIGRLEQFSVVSSAALFAWLLTADKAVENNIKIAYFLPGLLVICFGLIALGLYYRINLIGKYIKDTYEKYLNSDQNVNFGFGWENYLDKSIGSGGSLLANARFWMWMFLLFLDFFVATCLY